MTEQCGTPAYIAPEILRDQGYWGFSADIWSAGVVLYAMIFGTVPFKAGNIEDLHKLILKAKYSLKDTVSEDVKDLIKGMLERDPKRRLTIPEILAHPWMQNIDEKLEFFNDAELEQIKKEFNNYNDRYNKNTR